MEYSEKWGKDVEDAVKLALHDLKLERDQVEVVVLEEPSKGFFGIGSKLAKVRVHKKEIEKPKEAVKEVKVDKIDKVDRVDKAEKIDKIVKIEKSTEEDTLSVEEKEGEIPKEKPKRSKGKRASKESHRRSASIREKPLDLVEINDTPALEFLKDITKKMDLDVSVKAFSNDNSLYFEISGPDSGTIIGKRGQTLDSIQYLTSLVANKNKEKYFRVIVDAENYRIKRERTLEQLANRLGDKVQKTGKSVRLEPMNPYERKVIHATLQKNPSIVTRSEGEEPYRRVIIEKK